MASGITTASEVIDAYTQMKANKRFKWMTMKINDQHNLIELSTTRDGDIELKEEKDRECFEELKDMLSNIETPRYILYDLHNVRKNEENRIMEKILFITWCPDKMKVREKMVFAASKDNLKKLLPGIDKEVQASELGDLDYDDVMRQYDK